ncbi:MAG: hypothetical protein K5925_06050 [Bacilli bacterium]|nr:hypothetical protein [Bacilli bacterium]
MEKENVVATSEETIEKNEKVSEEVNEEVKEETTEEVVEESSEEPKKTKKKFFKRKRLIDYTAETDIKYRPPLSYRHFRIFGWLCLLIQLLFGTIATGFGMANDPSFVTRIDAFSNVSSIFGSLMAPFFLFATFSVLFNAKDGYKKLFITYGGLSLLIIVLYYIIYYHFITGIFNAIGVEQETVDALFMLFSKLGFLAINFFVDLFLCTLFAFFVNYVPKKMFKGKKIYIFRCFAIFPVLYEMISLVLKALASESIVTLPMALFPFLTSKPFATFFIFVILALIFKGRERHFIKHGKTKEEYRAFLNTNANIFHFGRTSAILCLIVSLIDIVLALFLSAVVVVTRYGAEAPAEAINEAIKVVTGWGIGGAAPLLLFAPVLLLFNYKKTYKKPLYDTIIPVASLGFIMIVMLETIFQLTLFIISKNVVT